MNVNLYLGVFLFNLNKVKNMSYVKNKKREKGFSLLELLLVMGVIAAMIIAAFIIHPKVMTHTRVNNELRNISTILNGIKALYSGSPDLTGFSNSVASKAKILPENMLVKGSANTFKNSWQGSFYMTLNSNIKAANGNIIWNAVAISTGGIPSSDCLRLSNELYRVYGKDLDFMTVNGQSAYSGSVSFDLGNVAQLCARKESADVVMVVRV